MSRVKTQILRKDNRFLDPTTKETIEEFPSISKAKKESRDLQSANGGLGRGYVQVIDTRDKKKLIPVQVAGFGSRTRIQNSAVVITLAAKHLVASREKIKRSISTRVKGRGNSP